jgi:chaperone modulatory protein CbpM
MTISKLDFIERARIDHETLEVWIEEEWLIPAQNERELAFSELDLARAKLIRDLTEQLGVNHDGIGVILNLLDQVHSLRKALADVLRSVRAGSVHSGSDPSSDEHRSRR